MQLSSWSLVDPRNRRHGSIPSVELPDGVLREQQIGVIDDVAAIKKTKVMRRLYEEKSNSYTGGTRSTPAMAI